ncbi:26S proteasome non-ATPase regulatory subunit 6 [Perkinsus olseni]|uniref:26S proteasome non-ATPase regulatory subunit 6 n=1 Tax=Perkinsus olseni TaxID=32597 RepID=A0A7J6QZJ2_PEROL|nr:26S proteasome non-ATPase regulatory subunit 6 [Perkinsus olseni]
MTECGFVAPRGSSKSCSFRSVAVAEDLKVDVVSSISGDFDSNVDLKSGFRVWECSIDLARYVHEHPAPVTKVLELGCGHALPGIAALLDSPTCTAYLHDLDPSVLRLITSQNVSRLPASAAKRTRYVTGAWGEGLTRLLKGDAGLFDLMLSSEGIYKQTSFEPLLAMLIDLLDPENGVALFAGKKLYFGCGGGTAPFMSFVEDHYSDTLTCRSVALFEDARSNIREIVEVHMDAISAGLPEEDTKTLPNMKHAQDRFILQCEDDVYSRQEKDAAKEELMKAIREQSQSVWYKELCEEFGWTPDQKLVAEMETKNEEELKKLELSIEDAQENLGDIEQRDAILNKGELYLRIGDREKAVEAFEEALKITVGVGARLDNILTQIRMNIFWNDIQGCKKNIDRAHSELSKGGDWERRNKLKVYDGLYQMMTRDFEAAAGQFLSGLQTFTATELMPFTDYIFYTVITSMVATDRKTVM